LNDIEPAVGADLSCSPPIIKSHDQNQQCHPERSEGSLDLGDNVLPISIVKTHYQPASKTTTITDAYCGVGTFALLLAHHVTKVIAIEESASAIKDAQWNLRNVSNVDILKGKTEDLLPALAAQLDGLVLDPPRAGCQPVVLDTLVQHPIKRIVYVSCDPATLARDLDILCHQQPTYHLCSVQPLDMFPQTVHIECIAVLEHNNV